MASGFGAFGSKGRCYDIWADLVKCNQRSSVKLDCVPYKEDYFECLFARKEIAKRKRIADEKKQKIKRGELKEKS